MMYRAVLFDLDGTLYDRDQLVERLFADQYDRILAGAQRCSRAEYVRRTVALDEHGHRPKEELYLTLARELGFSLELAEILRADFFSSYVSYCHAPHDDATETLAALHDAGIVLGVVTNGTSPMQESKLESLGLASFFKVVLVSEVEGVRKPDPVIFLRALQRCGVAPDQAVFVGDSPEADVVGAKRAGMLPIWKRVRYWHMPFSDVHAIDRLSEILPICLGPGRPGSSDCSVGQPPATR